MKNYVEILALLFLAGCQPTPAPAPFPDFVVDDGGLDDAGRDVCARACGHLRHLGCPDGKTTPSGATCEAVCRTDRADPAARLSARYLSCLAAVTTCAGEERCPR
jgi:hypothetical protein